MQPDKQKVESHVRRFIVIGGLPCWHDTTILILSSLHVFLAQWAACTNDQKRCCKIVAQRTQRVSYVISLSVRLSVFLFPCCCVRALEIHSRSFKDRKLYKFERHYYVGYWYPIMTQWTLITRLLAVFMLIHFFVIRHNWDVVAYLLRFFSDRCKAMFGQIYCFHIYGSAIVIVSSVCTSSVACKYMVTDKTAEK